MKQNLFYLIISLLILPSCSNDDKSQLVVLYKGTVEPGNSVISFVNKNDKTGQFATTHCENLRRLYIAREKINYICSTIVFDDFKPSIK
jgi:hypothetical protein